MRFKILILTLLFSQFSLSADALVFPMPEKGNDIVGKVQYVPAEEGDDFSKIALRYDVGYYELIEANPGVDPDFIAEGKEIVIPTQYILPPAAKREGIVINLAELRLFYFSPDHKEVLTEPVGIGRIGWQTPLGKTQIVAMTKNPTWYSTKNIREFRAKEGVIIPAVVKPGPDNPLGNYAMKLGWGSYLIHGTNEPSGVGRRASSGCIRMYPDGIEQLFSKVKVGTSVEVINQPYKIGWHNNQLYLEAHEPLQEDQFVPDPKKPNHMPVRIPFVDVVANATTMQSVQIDWSAVQKVGEENRGIPMVISQT